MRRDGRGISRYFVFATVSLGLLLPAISGTSVAVALEPIRSSFDTSVVLAGWVIGIYQLTLTASMPIVGKVSDVLGRKRTLMVCVSLFVLGSFLSALAPNVGLLIAARLIQALGGGGFLPSAVGIVATEFPESRQRAIGLFSSVFPVGQIVGPVIGGWLIHTFGWRAVFWFNVPTGLFVLVLVALLIPAGRRDNGHIDVIGAGLVVGGLSSLMSALSFIGYAETGRMWAVVGLLLATSAALTLLFLRHEMRTEAPIIDVEILTKKPFLAANVYNAVYGAGIIGVMSLIPLFAINSYGMSYLESGLILVPRAAGTMGASFVMSMLLTRLGYRWPIITGTSLAAASLVLLSLEPQHITMAGRSLDSVGSLSLVMLLMGVGVGIAAPASNNACIELMPERAATITGIRGMFRQAGGAVSITVATLVLQEASDFAFGFRIIFIGLAIALLATIPAVFAMPRSPSSVVSSRSVSR